MNPKARKAAKVTALVLFSLVILFILVRNMVLHLVISKAATKMERDYSILLEVDDAFFSGLSTVNLYGLSARPVNGDTLFRSDTISAGISLLNLITGTVEINTVYASNALMSISCHDGTCNYAGLTSHRKSAAPDTSAIEAEPGERVRRTKNYSLLVRRILDRVFHLAPQRAELKNISFIFRTDSLVRRLLIPEYHSDKISLSGSLLDLDEGNVWNCTGRFSKQGRSIDVTIIPSVRKGLLLPLTKELFGLTASFDTLQVGLAGYQWKRDVLNTEGNVSISGLTVHHWRVSDDTVRVPSASARFSFHAGENYFELDSASMFSLGQIDLNLYARYARGDSSDYTLKLNTGTTPSTEFFASLPEGMFDEVRGVEADGTLQFSLDFHINSLHPSDVIFDARMKKENFRIRRSKSVDLMKMSGEFTQVVYEGNKAVKSFVVGPSNPDFTPLEMISPFIVNSVLTSEDGSFFSHKGFNEDAFRSSIAANFEAGRFVRGGSTISMQLVKNVFLTRKKTIARKAEEALLVWLIESNRIYAKSRMMEVYLNIVEWGPDVYGIAPACAFYFMKKPMEVSLAESIFLASLLPQPKAFKYRFDTLGNLRPEMEGYYRIMGDIMLKRDQITKQDRDSLVANVTLSGPARDLVIPVDAVPEDLKIEEELILQ